MANCLIKNDVLQKDVCGYSLKQVIDIYLANLSDVTASTVGKPADGEGTEVKSITMASGARFYHIEPAQDSASFTDELQVGANGSKYRLHTINWNIAGTYTAEMADTVDALSLGKYVAVAKLGDGSYIMLGRVAGVTASVVTVQGAATADGDNGVLVTLTGNAVESALPLSEEAIETVTKGATV